MKHARTAISILFLFVTPLLLSGIIVPVDLEAETTLTQTPIKVILPSYEDRGPIIALNDTAMDYYASLLSWDGDGSPDTPYIIDGYNITDDGDCINIEDTTRAFEIRNCYISSWSGNHGNGIIFDNVTQAGVFDTVIEGKSDAAITFVTPAVVFDNVTVHGCSMGLQFVMSHGGTITGCHIYENFGDGIDLYDCNNTLIAENEIHDSVVGYGVYMSFSHHTNIINNHVSYCEASGLFLTDSHYATIEGNDIHDNSFFTGPMCGINLDNAAHASIVGNEIYNNERNGIHISDTDWANIVDNEIYNNSDHGIEVLFSANGTILENNIYGNGWWPAIVNELCGIFLGPALDWVISGNTIWNNTPSGITLQTAERIEISNNHIFNNTEQGIFALGGEGLAELDILENEIHHNGYSDVTPWSSAGILVYGYEDVSVINNLVYVNMEYGISVNGDNNRIIGNEVYGSETGIGTEECYFNLISENIVYDCLGGILVVNVGSNITHNIVYDNVYGIFMDWSGDCLIYGNDVGWNEVNGLERRTFEGQPLFWDDNVSVGNHWHDYDGLGVYEITNDTHIVNADRFPAISLNLSQASPISYEILEVGNVIVWEAYAMNPSHYEVYVDSELVLSETWTGGNIEFNADGLSHGTHTIGIEVFHVSGHSVENGTTAGVEDLTPPAVDGQAHVVITFGDPVSIQFTAEDPSGIASWAVNDTINFAISATGLLTNIADLPVGDYVVVVTATDIYGNTGFTDVTITVHPVTDGGLGTTMILLAGAGGAVVIVVVVVVLLKKKQT
jgi:parallel beta-helix repeat protein